MDPRFLASLTILLGLFFVNSYTAAGQVGVCYGRLGKHLPSAAKTVEIFKHKNIRRVRLYSPDEDVLLALRGTNIDVMLGLPNVDLERVASDQSVANEWVRNNVTRYVNDNVKFRYVSVGNEVNSSHDFARHLVPAMEKIDRALSGAGLGHIKVSTAIYMGMMGVSFPPSKGSFKGSEMVLMEPIIRFLVSKNYPLHLNLYPYFSYEEDKQKNQIRLDYALFTATQEVSDINQRSYRNLFDAMLDAVYSALERSRGGDSLEIVVSETGWPTAEGRDTNSENARIYNNNLIKHVTSKKGTPKKPGNGKEIETYIFAMYDENLKPTPPTVERFWGLFLPNAEPKYDVNFD